MSVSGLESSEWGLVSLPHVFVCLVVSDVSVGSRALILCFAFQRSATLLLLWVQLFGSGCRGLLQEAPGFC